MTSTIERVRESRAEALEAATDGVAEVRQALHSLGGVVNEVGSLHAALRWSTRRVVVTPYYDRLRNVETGRFVGSANVAIFVRDFDLLDSVEGIAADVDGFLINYATWQVDAENSAWREIRLEAIDAAMRKGRDYAVALGSRLVAVEHVADLGLLGTDPSSRSRGMAMAAAGGGSVAGFDPVPQPVTASVEARFQIAPVPLDH